MNRQTKPISTKTISFLSIAVLVLSSIGLAKYSDGTGEPNDPYQIATAEDLILLGDSPEDYDKHFILTADIDLNPNLPGRKVFNKAVIAPDRAIPFTGVLDGNRHTVLHFTISTWWDRGLFGSVASGGEIRDIGVVDLKTTGGDQAGGLVARNAGSVTRCYSTGSVSGYGWVGGLIGHNEGSVTQCYSTCTVTGVSWAIGGLVGDNYGTVTQCYSTGAVTLISSPYDAGVVGGLVGGNGGEVTQCYSTGAVIGGGWWAIGGLVGGYYSQGAHVVTNSFWDTQTSGRMTSAGGTGKTTAQMQAAATFFSWLVCGNEGGVWIINEGNDYPRLRWENKPGVVMEAVQLSDFLIGTGTANDPYLIYTADDVTLIGLFPCEQGAHFRLAFLAGQGTQESPYLIETAEQIDLLNLCPYERDAHFRLGFVAGEGTQESPYLVETAGGLNLLGMCPYERDAYFKLTADIDLSGFDGKDGRPAFNIIGASYDNGFTGVFDGSDHTISNFSHTCDGTYDIGLFGYVSGPNSVIKNLKLTWPNIDTGTGGRTGALVGCLEGGTIVNCHIDGGSVSGGQEIGGLVGHMNSGSITDCYSACTVSGDAYAGGLVGSNGECWRMCWGGLIKECYSTGSVSGTDYVGGLVGLNYGSVTRCYSTGAVSGSSSVGGLVGYNYGTISNCYSTGFVEGTGYYVGGLVADNEGRITNCYSTGSVTGSSYVGGLVGYNRATITNCYSTDIVSGDDVVGGLVGMNDSQGTIANCYSVGTVNGNYAVGGGLVGWNPVYCDYSGCWQGTISQSFWDIQTSGISYSAGGTGKTTASMETQSTFADVGWDFVGETVNGPNDVWRMCVDGMEYPLLSWQFALKGDFTCPDGVDILDLAFLVDRWLAECNETNNFCNCTDTDYDGQVNLPDFAILASHWLEEK